MAADAVPHTGHHPAAADGSAFNGTVGRGLADRMEAVLRQQKDVARVCDLGCGNGHLAGRLGRAGLTVVGVDSDPTYIDIAQRHHANANVTFRADVIDDGLPSRLGVMHQPFDLVVSSEVIEHLYHPQALLRSAFALLRPGGIVLISTPYHGYLKNVAISVLGRWDEHHSPHWHGGHVKFFSVSSLAAMIREAGFNQPEFHYYGRVAGFWKNMIAVATRD
jgi:SAM-dependent methyltransferase